MPKVAGTYRAVVRVKRQVFSVPAESKQDAIRKTLLHLASLEDSTDFIAWVNGGMEIEVAGR